MTHSEIALRRLHSQRLCGAKFSIPGEVVGWLGLVQAQDYAGASWALGLRMQDAIERDIEQAYAEGSILRTHILRPTWHFVTPADIRWMLALTGPRVHALNGTMYRKVGLEPGILRRTNDIIADAVAGGNWLTRDEVRQVLEQRGVEVGDGVRLGYILMSAELDGVVCSGPRRGKQFTYALLHERAPGEMPFERDTALAGLARRFFTSRGPATVQDFAKWSSLTLADAQRGLDGARGGLEHATVDGREYWYAEAASWGDETLPPALLISIYDELISGYKDHSPIAGADIGAKLQALGNDLYYLMLIDGQIAGTWKRTIKKDAVVMHLSPFAPLTDDQRRAVAEAAGRYGSFLARQVELA
jgi:hypothetical protein